MEAERTETTIGLTHLAATVAILAAFASSTYLIPALHPWRPWLPGDDTPIVRLFATDEEDAPQSIAGGALAPSTPEEARRRIAEELGDTVAANLGEEAGVARPGLAQPIAQRRGEVRIAPSELEGIAREIEDPSGHALDRFYAALAATARGERGAITRIAHYGDSSIASDRITFTMRRRLQARFGDAGHGFMLMTRGYMPYGHRDVTHTASSGWQIRQLVLGEIEDGWYGYGGVQARTTGRARATYGTATDSPVGGRVSRFELWYQKWSGGVDVHVAVDGGPERTIPTRAEQREDAWETIEVEDGPHTLALRAGGGGSARFYGIVLERDGPGVVYDSLGLVGARARRLLAFDAAHIERQVTHRDVDLLVLGFGGNEAGDGRMPIAMYENEMVQVIQRMRGSQRDLPCLIVAPLDQAEHDERGNIVSMAAMSQLVEGQRRAAAREGCGFWDTWQAMGGEGAMRRWFRARPRLAFPDYRHATPAGYEVISNMLYKALLAGFSDWLSRDPRRP